MGKLIGVVFLAIAIIIFAPAVGLGIALNTFGTILAGIFTLVGLFLIVVA